MKLFTVTMVLEVADKCADRKPDCDAVRRMMLEQVQKGRYDKDIFRGRVALDIVDVTTSVMQVLI